MIGITRGISTLGGAVVAGILLWFATQIGTQTNSGYWSTYGLIAAAIAFGFAVMLAKEFVARRRPYTALWALALLLYGVATLVVVIGAVGAAAIEKTKSAVPPAARRIPGMGL